MDYDLYDKIEEKINALEKRVDASLMGTVTMAEIIEAYETALYLICPPCDKNLYPLPGFEEDVTIDNAICFRHDAAAALREGRKLKQAWETDNANS